MIILAIQLTFWAICALFLLAILTDYLMDRVGKEALQKAIWVFGICALIAYLFI